jgi:hypothetical protein
MSKTGPESAPGHDGLRSVATTVQGKVCLRRRDGGIGAALAGVVLTFVAEDRSATYSAVSDGNGSYSINLPSRRYLLRATHPDYATAACRDSWWPPARAKPAISSCASPPSRR